MPRFVRASGRSASNLQGGDQFVQCRGKRRLVAFGQIAFVRTGERTRRAHAHFTDRVTQAVSERGDGIRGIRLLQRSRRRRTHERIVVVQCGGERLVGRRCRPLRQSLDSARTARSPTASDPLAIARNLIGSARVTPVVRVERLGEPLKTFRLAAGPALDLGGGPRGLAIAMAFGAWLGHTHRHGPIRPRNAHGMIVARIDDHVAAHRHVAGRAFGPLGAVGVMVVTLGRRTSSRDGTACRRHCRAP